MDDGRRDQFGLQSWASPVRGLFFVALPTDFPSTLLGIQQLKVEKGYALTDILTEVHDFVHQLEMPPACRVFVLDKMADIEHKLNVGCTEKIQLGALIGAFAIATDLATK